MEDPGQEAGNNESFELEVEGIGLEYPQWSHEGLGRMGLTWIYSLEVGEMPGLTGSSHLMVQRVGLENAGLIGLGLEDQKLEQI